MDSTFEWVIVSHIARNPSFYTGYRNRHNNPRYSFEILEAKRYETETAAKHDQSEFRLPGEPVKEGDLIKDLKELHLTNRIYH